MDKSIGVFSLPSVYSGAVEDMIEVVVGPVNTNLCSHEIIPNRGIKQSSAAKQQ